MGVLVSLSGKDQPVKNRCKSCHICKAAVAHCNFGDIFFKLNCSRASEGSKQVKIFQNCAPKKDFNGFLSQVTFSVAQLNPDFHSAATRFNSPPQRGMLEASLFFFLIFI